MIIINIITHAEYKGSYDSPAPAISYNSGKPLSKCYAGRSPLLHTERFKFFSMVTKYLDSHKFCLKSPFFKGGFRGIFRVLP
jgi:hypothetical protein